VRGGFVSWFAALATITSGCGLGRAIDPAVPLTLARDEALIVVATEAVGLVTFDLCRDADYLSCVTIGPISPSHSLAVYAVPAGYYCAMEVRFEPAADERFTWAFQPSEAMCFWARAGEIDYPGHLGIALIDTTAVNNARLTGWHHLDVTRAQLDTAYPRLRDRELTVANVERYSARAH
jgi:hypothetical protein